MTARLSSLSSSSTRVKARAATGAGRPGFGKGGVHTSYTHSLFPQNLLHLFSLCQLIDQLIQIANFLHGGFFDVFHSDTADHTFDQSPRRIQLGGFRVEGLEVCLIFQVRF
jgi:hypothetical protein